jgi:hypothetical protein
VLPTIESCFSCRCRSLSLACISPWLQSTERSWPPVAFFLHVDTMQRVPPCCALPRYPCSWPHLPSVLAGRQVVEGCEGPRTLVPRARCEHVVNMGRCGHTCEQPCHPDKPQTFVAFLCACFTTIRIPAPPYLALCCEACSAPCARN